MSEDKQARVNRLLTAIEESNVLEKLKEARVIDANTDLTKVLDKARQIQQKNETSMTWIIDEHFNLIRIVPDEDEEE